MKYTTKNIINHGNKDTILYGSNDKYKINLNKKYKLVGHSSNKYTNAFNNSILGMEVGVHSNNFISKIIVATILDIIVIVTMYLLFRI